MSPYDVRAPITVPGGGPAVLKVIGESSAADDAAARLTAVGFDVHVVPVKVARPRFDVRRFDFAPHALRVENPQGEGIELPYDAIRCIVHAHALEQLVATEPIRKTKFSLGLAVLTGGLVMLKTEESTRTSHSAQSDELLFVFPRGGDPLMLAQTRLVYQGLGDKLQSSQLANFNLVAAEFRRRSPGAVIDERLRRLSARRSRPTHTSSSRSRSWRRAWAVVRAATEADADRPSKMVDGEATDEPTRRDQRRASARLRGEGPVRSRAAKTQL